MRKMLLTFAFVMVVFSSFMQSAFCEVTASGPQDVPRMTKEELKAQLSNPDFVIIDVRAAHDWQDSNTKIKGAARQDPYKLGSWIDKYPQNKTIVLYCA
jgi:hypothetical protein